MTKAEAPSRITIASDAADRVASSGPVTWAVDRLRDALEARAIPVRIAPLSDVDGVDSRTVVVADAASSTAAAAIARAGLQRSSGPESFALVPSDASASAVFLCGSAPLGLVYAVLELADRVAHSDDFRDALNFEPTVERPTNKVRSVARLFCSEVEDKGWFHDEPFWHRYLTMLVLQRFNRFSLTLGLGYNYPRTVTDAYLYFAYPFLVAVPGHDVRVPQLPEDERERNLQMLRFISKQAVARGLHFQLGLWTHAFEWKESPNAHHTIEGLAAERHAEYCRDAVAMLLAECPAIGGVTFRIHGESGIPERSWDFWKTVFDGVESAGRTVGIDLHAKGLDERTLNNALETGMPVTVSPKFWAEHMGLPYHQAAIRELERPIRVDPSHRSEWHRYMSVSEGSRPFTRYGYADFLREDRDYDVVFRLWAGTQRVLVWGDPAMAAAYGRAAGFAGAQGLEWCEPLTFKGREGTGREGSRTGYADAALIPSDDWEKHAYAYRLFGRLLYDPETPPEQWRRSLRRTFGPAASAAESALASASRILPLVTTAHHPSASNNYFWPEMYTDIPIVWSVENGEERTRPHPYLDTPTPRRAGTVGALDPEVFSSASEFVQELLVGELSGRTSPLEVAWQLEAWADEAARGIDAVERGVGTNGADGADVRRWIVDIRILAALGRFFSGKLTAAAWYELHAATGSGEALRSAIDAYRGARDAWEDASTRADVYVNDLTYGPQPWLRGHWTDRTAAFEADLADMEDRWGAEVETTDHGDTVRRLSKGVDIDIHVHHVPPMDFRPGEDLALRVELRGSAPRPVDAMTLRYRPLNQALEVRVQAMDRMGDTFTAQVRGTELDGAYALAYSFVVRAEGIAWRYPNLGVNLCQQPYFVARPARP